jgi:hypothetical protein
MLGYGGYCLTKRHHYSTTFRALRAAHRAYIARRRHGPTVALDADGRLLPPAGMVTVAGWEYAGRGYTHRRRLARRQHGRRPPGTPAHLRGAGLRCLNTVAGSQRREERPAAVTRPTRPCGPRRACRVQHCRVDAEDAGGAWSAGDDSRPCGSCEDPGADGTRAAYTFQSGSIRSGSNGARDPCGYTLTLLSTAARIARFRSMP